MLIDSHVNLHSEKYADDLDETIKRAREAGVSAMLTISDQLSSTEAIKSVSARCRFHLAFCRRSSTLCKRRS